MAVRLVQMKRLWSNGFLTPFDLSRAPLLNVALVKRKDKHFILVVNMHHIITDGLSHTILVDEFAALYNGEDLPPLKLQYKDYSCTQNRILRSGGVKKPGRILVKQV